MPGSNLSLFGKAGGGWHLINNSYIISYNNIIIYYISYMFPLFWGKQTFPEFSRDP